MKEIIPPVDSDLIIKELTREKFIRRTNNAGNELYVVTHHDSPNTIREIGRLREISFRTAGGGTGLEMDIDSFDTSEKPYYQLIVWDPDAQEILGGYRFFLCSDPGPDCIDPSLLATSELFRFSEEFVRDYLPYTIELGRSFVQPDYQSTSSSRKSLYALDNLWDGLGALVKKNPRMKYFFGKVTMFPHFNREARNLILHFMSHQFPDPDQLVVPIEPVIPEVDREEMKKIFTGGDFRENYRILSQRVRALGEVIPPLFNAYINLTPSMRVFGTAVNEHFGKTEETGLMITIPDIYAAKVERHVHTFREDEPIQ